MSRSAQLSSQVLSRKSDSPISAEEVVVQMPKSAHTDVKEILMTSVRNHMERLTEQISI